MYSARMFDQNRDGKLSFEELMEFFELFFRFSMHHEKANSPTSTKIRKAALKLVKRYFALTGAEKDPGISIDEFILIEKSHF